MQSESTSNSPTAARQCHVTRLNDHAHTYLGDLIDMRAPSEPRDAGTLLTLPVVLLSGDSVLFPGELLPLQLQKPSELRAFLSVLPGCHGLFVAFQAALYRDDQNIPSHIAAPRIGCTAEVQRIRRDTRYLKLVARGCQRVIVSLGGIQRGFLTADVEVLPFGEAKPVAEDERQGSAFPWWMMRQTDTYNMADETLSALRHQSPKQAAYVEAGRRWGPEALSYRLTALLPLGSDRRQQLSEETNCVLRLRRLVRGIAAVSL